MRLKIEREGDFSVANMIENPNKCGMYEKASFHYRVEIDGNSGHLTPQGFIIDNNDIQGYFDKTYTKNTAKIPFISCENMAAKAVRDFRNSLKVKVYGIKVTIWGSEHASLTAYWKAKPEAVKIPKPQH